MKKVSLVIVAFLSTFTTAFYVNPVAAAFSNVNCTNGSHLSNLGIPQADCEALEAIWDSTGGVNWTTNTNWDDEIEPAGDWYGVNVASGRVSTLSLESNNLIGTIPQELGNLTGLSWLNLQSNQLTGLIPTQLGSLTNLSTLILDHNQLNGTIPTELGLLTTLSRLDLDHNEITGAIPTEFQNLTALTRLTLGSNNLSGRIPDLTGLALGVLNTFGFAGNGFVFADFEPEYVIYRANIAALGYTPQAAVDTDRVDSFAVGETLTITPQLAVNPSGNDVYQWRKDGVVIPGPAGTQRVFSKVAGVSDAGLYWYSVTNTVVTGAQLNATIVADTGITVSITSTPPPPSTYIVGGSVTGLTGTLVLQNNGGDNEAILSGATSYQFDTPLPNGADWGVTVLTDSIGQTCTISNDTGTISASDVTDADVDCVDDPPAPAAPAVAVPAMSVYGLALTALGLLLVAARRLRASARLR